MEDAEIALQRINAHDFKTYTTDEVREWLKKKMFKVVWESKARAELAELPYSLKILDKVEIYTLLKPLLN